MKKAEALSNMKVPLGQGVAGKCAQDRQSVIVNNDKSDEIYKKVDEKTKFVTRNLICVPMIVDDKIIGVIEAVNSLERNNYTNEDLEVLKYLADQAAISINNRQLFDKLAKAYKQIRHRAFELSALYELLQRTKLCFIS